MHNSQFDNAILYVGTVVNEKLLVVLFRWQSECAVRNILGVGCDVVPLLGYKVPLLPLDIMKRRTNILAPQMNL